ncbi:MAG: hypothetical protein D4R50_03370 [Actinomycetales bacterium]|nr:MAG: hypothetical protein D4R50_03370 [Actinomycetales bacterium]
MYFCAALDAFSRKIVGWSIDNNQNSNLVVNAMEMAIKNRAPSSDAVIHSDHGVQFTSGPARYLPARLKKHHYCHLLASLAIRMTIQ